MLVSSLVSWRANGFVPLPHGCGGDEQSAWRCDRPGFGAGGRLAAAGSKGGCGHESRSVIVCHKIGTFQNKKVGG